MNTPENTPENSHPRTHDRMRGLFARRLFSASHWRRLNPEPDHFTSLSESELGWMVLSVCAVSFLLGLLSLL